jgi:hypothetical protein
MRKHVAGGMLIGLAFFLGCNQAPHKPALEADLGPRLGLLRDAPGQSPRKPALDLDSLPRGQTALAPRPSADKPAEIAERLVVVRPAEPLVPALAVSRPARPFEAPPPVPTPEPVVRVSAGWAPPTPPPPPASLASAPCSQETAPPPLFKEPPQTSDLVPQPPVVKHVVVRVSAAPAPVARTSYQEPAAAGSRQEPPRLIVADLREPAVRPAFLPESPPRTCFDHAGDYSWLTGELQYIRTRKVWRLQYAPSDQEDRYGGTVCLVGDGLPADAQSGAIVHVEGQLVNPDADDPRPPYCVRKVQVLKAAPRLED